MKFFQSIFFVVFFINGYSQEPKNPGNVSRIDSNLVLQLDSIHYDDQFYREEIEVIEKKFGWDSEEITKHWKLINLTDSLNVLKVTGIIDKYGWLGPQVIGEKGNKTLFLIIQHADTSTQKKYLPIMREAVKQGNAKADQLAFLEDRVSLREKGMQIYGSQLGRNPNTGELLLFPIIDPKNVDRRRIEVGLDSLQNYISIWGLTWDVDEHKRKNDL